MRRGARDGLLDAGRETTDASLVSHLTPPRVSCLASLSTWKKAKLIELCKFQRGFDISKKEQRAGTIPVISSSGITSFHDTAKCKGPGVLVGRKGTLGTVHYCEGPYWPHSTALWVKDFKGNEPRFVYYFLKTLSFEHYDVGNANPTLNRNHVHLLDITIPPLSEQRCIVGILSAYDDLIENNRKRIALLEESARRLYKEWFVRLRFPDHEHVPVEDGVPKGWKRRFLPDLIEINPAEARPKTDSILYVPMSALATDGMTVDLSESEHRETSTSVRFRNGDTLLARITPCLENGKTGFVDFLAEGEVACGSTEFIVLRGKTVSPAFVYCLARTDDFRETAIKSMVGSSGRQRVQPACFDEYPVLEPERAVLKQFDRFAGPAFAQIATLRRESEKLAAARDALLPRLMKGGVG